jgi:hypothetical protein
MARAGKRQLAPFSTFPGVYLFDYLLGDLTCFCHGKDQSGTGTYGSVTPPTPSQPSPAAPFVLTDRSAFQQ